MINVNNVSKSFFEQKVLNNISLSFPDKGLYFILGQSGCGKSTLLNCISGLMDYQGEITINGDNFKLMKEDDISDYRLRNIGFIFQDFKLFQHDTVFDNVVLPMQCISMMDNHYQEQRVEDILEIVGIKHLMHEKIANLSGGEKQRIAIARAMINDPKVLLCDEPTGSLDSINKVAIMTILKTIATTRLVLIVSHDEELTKQYADGIYHLKDGKLFKSTINKIDEEKKYLPIFKGNNALKKSKVPNSFLYRHTRNAIKQRKFRSIITNLMVSFGLLGSGLAFMVSDTIYQSVVGMYSNIVSDNQIMMTLNASNKVSNQIISASENEVREIKGKYSDDIEDVGVCYFANFEEYYKDSNSLLLLDSSDRYSISGYSARSINDFDWLENCNKTIYPDDISELKDDEIILSINPEIIRTLCYHLRIEKTVESLSNYILKNTVLLCFDFANFDWQYADEQILRFKGFVLDSEPIIYHSNHGWNSYIFEHMMRMPVNENISAQEYYPWVLKKINYLALKENPEKFLYKTRVEDDLNNYVFEIASKQYFPILNKDKRPYNNKRILMYKNKFLTINSSDWKYIKTLQKSVRNPIFSTNSGYSVYGTSLLSGFNKVMFFANSEELLDTTTGIFSSNGYDPTASIVLPDGVLQGHYTKTSNNGVFFKGIEGEKIVGNPP